MNMSEQNKNHGRMSEWGKGFLFGIFSGVAGITLPLGLLYSSGKTFSIESVTPTAAEMSNMVVQQRRNYDQDCLQKHRVVGTQLAFVDSCEVWPRPSPTLVTR